MEKFDLSEISGNEKEKAVSLVDKIEKKNIFLTFENLRKSNIPKLEILLLLNSGLLILNSNRL
jgi:hypothetical protein